MINFNIDVIEASHHQPVLVDFYASWCGPCNMLSPVLDEVAKGSARQVKLVKVDTEKHQDLAGKLEVTGIPDVRLFVEGKQVGGFTGFRPKLAVEQFLKENLPMKKV